MMTEERLSQLANGRWLSASSREIEEMAKDLLALRTQPASPALKLPDEMVMPIFQHHQWADRAMAQKEVDSWNACLAEVKRINAPHTAPIEPICATGGAEWVKVPQQMTPEMIKAVQQNTEIGSYIAANWAGAYSLFDEFYKSALAAAPEEK